MINYTPPYTITSKTIKLQFAQLVKAKLMLRKKNRIKTLTGTLEIEGKYNG
jgi:hypothetical protein